MKKTEIPSVNISKLDWSNCDLKTIPKEVFQLKNLRKLILSNNNITEIPVEITQLKRLEVLDLSNNKISNVYTKFCEISGLRILILRNNKIEILPKQIEKLQRLRKLDLSGNKIKKIPEELSNLKNLVSINLSNNQLTQLPNSLFSLKNLQHLWIANLPLTKFSTSTITDSFKSLKTIHTFSSKPLLENIDADYQELSKISGNSLKKLIEINNYYQSKYLEYKDQETKKMVDGKENNEVNKVKQIKKKFFISYSKYDEDYKNEFVKHLITLKDNCNVEEFNCDEIKLGANSHEVIQDQLKTCDYIIALVSVDFLNTAYIRDFEVAKAKELGKKIIPIIIKPCDWEESIIKDFHASLRGTTISLDKQLFLQNVIKESTANERHARWVAIVKEFRAKIFS